MKNKTWILLRGLAREKGHWCSFVDQFTERFREDEVLALDLPGVGEFRARPSPRSIGEIYEFVRARAVERSSAQTQFSVLALSLGGMVAIEWMRARPEDVERCVLVNSSSMALSPVYHRLRWQVWRRFMRLPFIASARDREKAILDLVTNSEAARELALPIWSRLAVEHPIRYTTLLNQLYAASKFDALPSSKVPTLVLCGLGDRLVDPSCSARLQERFACPMEKHPWAGHDLALDDPNWMLQKIESWSKASASPQK